MSKPVLKDAKDEPLSIEVRIADMHDADELAAMNLEFNGVNVGTRHILNELAKSREIVVVAAVNGSVAGFAWATITTCAPMFSKVIGVSLEKTRSH